MAVVVIITGAAWVGLQRPLARQRLRSAADSVRSEWCQARVDAMKSGHTYAFRYLVHGNRYHLAARDDSSSVGSAPAAQPAASDEEELGDEPLPPPVEKTLPEGIRFLPGEVGGGSAAMGDSPGAKPVDAGGDWSDPIYFYSDGSTSDARLLLAADQHSAMRLILRGVTGSVTVEDTTAMTQ
jgi:hypothetical protein